MIKILLSRITQDGIKIFGEETSECLGLIENDDMKILGPIKYNIVASLVNNGVLVTGEADILVKYRCSNCLEYFAFKLANNNICHFYEKPNKNEICLTDDIREDILINFPQTLKCKQSCKGLCFKCGQNLNLKTCSCEGEEEQENAWNELNKLDF